MTMLSFRVGDDDATNLQRWADQLEIDRSQLLRDALHKHLVRLASEVDAERWVNLPLSDDEMALGEIAFWVPAEDWTEWTDATR